MEEKIRLKVFVFEQKMPKLIVLLVFMIWFLNAMFNMFYTYTCSIAKDAAQPAARTFVIFKTIETACRMQRRGLSIPSIIVGPCSSKAGAVQMGKNTYFTEKELAAADELTEHGTEIAFQLLPNEPKTLYRDVRKK